MSTTKTGHKEAKDLIDFFNRWQEFRGDAVVLMTNNTLNNNEKNIIHWLISLADRVSDDDISKH